MLVFSRNSTTVKLHYCGAKNRAILFPFLDTQPSENLILVIKQICDDPKNTVCVCVLSVGVVKKVLARGLTCVRNLQLQVSTDTLLGLFSNNYLDPSYQICS